LLPISRRASREEIRIGTVRNLDRHPKAAMNERIKSGQRR
jgi:hypothetical protein